MSHDVDEWWKKKSFSLYLLTSDIIVIFVIFRDDAFAQHSCWLSHTLIRGQKNIHVLIYIFFIFVLIIKSQKSWLWRLQWSFYFSFWNLKPDWNGSFRVFSYDIASCFWQWGCDSHNNFKVRLALAKRNSSWSHQLHHALTILCFPNKCFLLSVCRNYFICTLKSLIDQYDLLV